MTNYNERLDKILFKVTGSKGLNIRDSITGDRRAEAKQAITSLIKELVADAKPFDYVPEGHEPDACLNHEKYTSACYGCRNQSSRVNSLDEFEQNLLKELEEV